jgi:hypothetical protein
MPVTFYKKKRVKKSLNTLWSLFTRLRARKALTHQQPSVGCEPLADNIHTKGEDAMRKFTLLLVIAVLVLATAFITIGVAWGQGPDGPQIINRETQGDNVREITAPATGSAPQQPNIGFIDSPSATCYQPDPGRDECYLTWYYMSVDANPNYMITMTLILNDTGPVAHTQGFFQTSMYVPYNMLGKGFKVACGSLGAGGNPQLGNAYAYTIRARDSAALSSANYGTTYCPAFNP